MTQYFVVLDVGGGKMRVIGAAPHSGGGCIGWTTLAPALHAATLYKGARVATKVDDDVLTVMPSD